MKEDINLLAPEEKEKRMKRVFTRRANIVYRGVVAGLFLVLLAYSGAGWLQYQQRSELQNRVHNTEAIDEKIRSEIEDVNGLMTVIEQRVIAWYLWTEQLSSVFSVLPPAVTTGTVNLQNDPERLVIEGVSASRAGVVQYEQNLRELPWVKSVEAPLRNFAGGTNIQFSMTIFHNE